MAERTLGMWVLLALALGFPLALSIYDAQLEARPAPAFTLTSTGYENGTMQEPTTFSLADYRGKTVLLDMMAVHCESCRFVTEKVLRPVHAEFAGVDFVILSIDTWADPDAASGFRETEEELVALQQEEGVPWRHALDTDDVWRKYSAVSLPKLVLVDGEGRIVYERHGVPPLDDVRTAIRSSLAGTATEVPVLQVGLIGLGFLAGVLSFFSPCSVGLVPAYMGLLLRGAQTAPASVRVRRTLAGGAATAAGIVAMYAVIALGLWAAGPALRAHLGIVRPVVAGLLIVLGILLLFGADWGPLVRRLGRVDGRKGFFAFGLGFALASFGCTGPAFLPILLGGFAEGPVLGGAVFAAYTLAIVGFVLVAALMVASGHDGRLSAALAHTAWITRAAAVLLVLAGAYLLWFDWQAGAFG